MSYGLIREKFTESLTTSTIEIGNFAVNNVERISGDIAVTGDPLTAFTLSVHFHSPNRKHTMASSATDYNIPQGLLIGASGDLTTLASEGWFIMDTRAVAYVIIEASSLGTSNIEVLIGG